MALTTLATLSAGNQPASIIDGNFTYLLGLINGLAGGGLRDYLAGLNLSNDSTTPNSVLDVSAGVAADSTNAVLISLGSTFYCSTGGPWSAGAGTAGSPVNKMGTGLTIANSTWYHVFAIVNTGANDVYFDTSVTAANAPAGTTASRRIGSFKTDGTAHIIPFSQNGDEFLWSVSVQDMNKSTPSASAALIAFTVPTGVKVNALFRASGNGASGNGILFTSPDESDQAPTIGGGGTPGFNTFEFNNATDGGQTLNVRTNTAAQVRWRSANTVGSVSSWTYGWIDARGQYV